MRSKVLALWSDLHMPENLAKRCHFSGRCHSSLKSHGLAGRASGAGPKSMRTLCILVCLFAMPSLTLAQTNQMSWQNLSALQSGQKIQVAGMKSKTISGAFVSVSDTAISLQTHGGEQTIQRQDVRNVKLMENKHRLRNTVLGGAVGAGVGAGIGAAAYRSCTPAQSFCIDPIGRGGEAGISAIVGFAGGALVGALWPSHKTIYSVTAK
jgi:hypothetical protein